MARLGLIASLLALPLLTAAGQPLQILASPAFERFAEATESVCPSRQYRSITPGDLDWEEQSYLESLPPERSSSILDASDARKRCAGRDGLSCPATATLEAIEKRSDVHDFAVFACAHVPPHYSVAQ